MHLTATCKERSIGLSRYGVVHIDGGHFVGRPFSLLRERLEGRPLPQARMLGHMLIFALQETMVSTSTYMR